MSQPSVADYFKVKRRTREDQEDLNKALVVDKINKVPPVNSVNTELPPEISNIQLRLPTLTPLGSPSKCLESSEVHRRMTLGPPRLTPIKNGLPVQVPPSSPKGSKHSVTRVLEFVENEAQLGGLASASDQKCPSGNLQQNVNGTRSPKLSHICRSPTKPSPSFIGKSVVKRLFCIDDDHEDKETNDLGKETNFGILPAYQRFAHLVLPTHEDGHVNTKLGPSTSSNGCDYSDALPLPNAYKALLEIFRSVETVSSFFFNRKEAITFQKLKSKVTDLIPGVPLQKSHLAQILTVLPNSYDLSPGPTDLILVPNFMSTSDTILINSMTSEVLMDRRNLFQQKLIEICQEHHQKFLASYNPPIEIPANKKVTRWHPKFLLNQVPDIDPSPLVQLHSTKNQKSGSSKHFHKKSVSSRRSEKGDIVRAKLKLMDLVKRNPKLKARLSEIAVKNNGNGAKSTEKKLVSLKGVSGNLLERIRVRERMKAVRSMTLTSQEGKDREMLTRLPTFVRMIRNVLLVEKKGVIPMHLLVDRLIHSQSSVSNQTQVEGHLRLIEKLVPEWLMILKGTNGAYIKIDKDVEINGIVEQVEMLIRKAGHCA